MILTLGLTICAIKEWWNMTSSGQARTFSQEIPNPFKPGRVSPLREIPGGGMISTIKSDIMHIWNLGIGGDLSASTIVLLCEMGQFAGRGLPARMDSAFDAFMEWCMMNHKTPSTKSFEKSRFHMKKTLGPIQFFNRLLVLVACKLESVFP